MIAHLVAALLCSAITSRRDARAVRELHRAASRVLSADRSTASQRAAAQAAAERLWDLVEAQPEGDRVPVLVAVSRALLDDAPDHCVDLDRAWRECSTRHGWPVRGPHAETARALLVALSEPS